MRIRTIKPEWLDDERIVCASPEARVLTIALILLADDHGRGRASPTVLAGRVFPAAANPRETLAKALDDLAGLACVVMYERDGQSYCAIRNWDRHQKVDKPGKPQVPPPPSGNTANQAVSADVESPRETLAKVPETLATDQDQDQDQEGSGTRASAHENPAAAPPVEAPVMPAHVERFERSLVTPTSAHAAVVALVSETRQAAGGAPFRATGWADRDAVQKLAEWSGAPEIGPDRLRAALTSFWATKGTGARLSYLVEEDPGRFLGAPKRARGGPAAPSSHEEHAAEVRANGGEGRGRARLTNVF